MAALPVIARIAAALVTTLLPGHAVGHALDPLPLATRACPESGAPSAAAATRLLPGTGEHRMAISTRVPQAQRFFDQGLAFVWGFNFDGAVRSFGEAARLDPECAMCQWGIAYALGPSINHDVDSVGAAAARSAVERATGLAPGAGARERALIRALAKRHAASPSAGRPALDRAYARAMSEVADQFPADADVLTFYADALMTAHGRDYWRRNGAPQPWTPRILAVLERALKIAPAHPGANHYYVHLLEDSPHPERALASAKRLVAVAPGVGHLVHMSAHIEFRLGDYDAAAEANERAIAADRAYLEAACADRRYIAGYVAHDFHFLWAAALMAGRSATARAAAVELTRYVEATAPSGPRNGTEQHFLALPLYTLVRFGQWQAIIAAPRPPAATPYTDGVWRFARGMAYVRTGQLSRAQREFEGLEMNLHAAALDAKELKNTNPLSRLLALAARLLKAELAGAAGDIAGAVAHARAAVRIESGLDPDEPPAWHMPARHTLGALLLEAGQPRQAERVYREDLKLHPENGWALAGLADSLALQGRASAAADARRRLARAWASADIAVSGSRY